MHPFFPLFLLFLPPHRDSSHPCVSHAPSGKERPMQLTAHSLSLNGHTYAAATSREQSCMIVFS
jgi:hypothetical protein